ncbi:hypothetical protein PORY_002459 [Pneumocystis oryctolagi]|uniref:Uncharacterized protein n=1 Tax=Pneumocystis oryctolagi TaxID=42067 RepID=A0ACB7C9Q4_9ASCO|nr:hypothetical protein PORY_002459 [Pneumocystis oryctolagi]
MADLLTGPIREGNRGGHGLFRWENVKEDKYRENYLGHSLRAPVGRWQKGRDLTWYAKGKKEATTISRDVRAEEIRKIKEAEKDALAEALSRGFEVEKKTVSTATAEEVASAIHRTDKEMEINSVDVAMNQVNSTEGLGFKMYNIDLHLSRDLRFRKTTRYDMPKNQTEINTTETVKQGRALKRDSKERVESQDSQNLYKRSRTHRSRSRHRRSRDYSRDSYDRYRNHNSHRSHFKNHN